LLHLLRKHTIYQPQPGWGAYIVKVVIAVAVMSALLGWLMGDAQWWLAQSFGGRVIRLSMLVAGGITVYFLSLWLMGFRPRQFYRRAAE
jgi:putative peptidoglycan lipid II flippase